LAICRANVLLKIVMVGIENLKNDEPTYFEGETFDTADEKY
jgi:hypothetical protein